MGTNLDYIITFYAVLCVKRPCYFNFYLSQCNFRGYAGFGIPEKRLTPWNKTALSAPLAALTLILMVILMAALAENATAQVPIRTRPSTGPGTTRRPRLEPCWEVAGVSKSAMQQRRAVALQARQEVEAVCSNSSLSIQQKRQQIQRIHQQERQQIEAIITPAQ